MTLPIIGARDLPRLAYSHGTTHDPALTHPRRFRPPINSSYICKPEDGGLWTAPVTKEGLKGEIVSTEWTDWCRSEQFNEEHYLLFQEIVPDPGAKVLLIDSMADLKAILAVYGLTPITYLPFITQVPDWERMVEDEIDAVYLTDAGQWATRMPPHGEPNLYTWDMPSVLWLRPSYAVPSLP